MENMIMKRFENAIGGNGIGESDYPGTADVIHNFLKAYSIDTQFNVYPGELSIGDEGAPYRIDTVTFPAFGFSAELMLVYCMQWEWSVLDVTDAHIIQPACT